jgi:Protein of unknown function (DUF4065)
MKKSHTTEFPTPLDKVTASIVYLMNSVGVYQYNKFAYLFEYFFIKNFGGRYTGEGFIKLPHGPAISGYKKQILTIANKKLFDVDVERLNISYPIDDDRNLQSILVRKNENTHQLLITEPQVMGLVDVIVQKFGDKSIDELESIVYSTSPVKNFQTNPFKKQKGGYVLAGDCVRMRDYKNPVTDGRMMALKHLRKFPTVDYELQNKLAEELAPLQKMRPACPL